MMQLNCLYKAHLLLQPLMWPVVLSSPGTSVGIFLWVGLLFVPPTPEENVIRHDVQVLELI